MDMLRKVVYIIGPAFVHLLRREEVLFLIV
jgi:hypothetical protein